MESPKKKVFLKRLKSRYRLVVLNDNTFEEKFSITLAPIKLFVLVGSITLLLIVLITSVIAFTPLREYIPGYADINMRRQLVAMLLKTDSLEYQLSVKSAYIQNINNIINDKVPFDEGQKMVKDSLKNYKNISIKPSKEDSSLRKEIESQDQYNLTLTDNGANKNTVAGFLFFAPLKGLVSNSFNVVEEHFGVDVVAKENESIKATLDGTVIFSNWTVETGYTMQIQHANNLVSVYKHNSALLKRSGQYVKAGEVVAIIGNSGELSTGPHLHFELWYNGNPLNPQDYIVF